MKFQVLQGNFVKALNQVSRIVSNRTTLPVLSNVLISTEKSKIRISATDLEVAITAYAAGSVEEDGKLTIPARLLSDFVTNNHDESITFTTPKENIVNLKSEHFEANINGISAEEYPTIPSVPTENKYVLKTNEFSDAVKKVVIACAIDETRPVLAGIYFQFKGKVLTLAATDSFRLAEKKLTLEEEAKESKFIVPVRTMTEVLRLISGTDQENVTLSFTENQVAFKIGESEIVSRLIEGAFPNYSQIIPASSKVVVVADYRGLVDAVKMSSLFSKNSANNIRIKNKKGELIVSSATTETGESTSKVAAEVTGESKEIAFNAKYILDVLQVLESDKVILEFNDEASAGVIRTEKDKGYIYIAMPLRIDS